ncbi:hypothetical protein, partial [Xanthomonas phaseoli]|uniref:hypothetical protein n=3 Tax=Xanthomonas phaseoli TaxID=1985254 RepID=UPI003CCF48FF
MAHQRSASDRCARCLRRTRRRPPLHAFRLHFLRDLRMHATIHPATSPRTLPLRHCPLAIALAAALLAMPVSGLAQVA